MSADPHLHWPAPGVLVVDDEPLLLNLLELVLRRQGFHVFACNSGKTAVDTYRRHSHEIHVVLLDVCMPGLDGVATLAELRHLNPGVRACFMSGYTQRYSVEELLALGAVRFFDKPFEIQSLADVLWTLANASSRQSA